MAMMEIRKTSTRPSAPTQKPVCAPVHTRWLASCRCCGVDLTVEGGDEVAFAPLLPGSGKTTLLRCLNFLETADAGQLVLDGETFDLAHAGRADIARLRKKTAFVFQNYNLFRNKTALQNVTEGLIVARRMPREQADAIGRRMLEKVGLADWADYHPLELSGGRANANSHCPCPGHRPGDHLFRRAHQCAGPGADRRGAERDAPAGRRGHDHAGGDPRDGLCPAFPPRDGVPAWRTAWWWSRLPPANSLPTRRRSAPAPFCKRSPTRSDIRSSGSFLLGHEYGLRLPAHAAALERALHSSAVLTATPCFRRWRRSLPLQAVSSPALLPYGNRVPPQWTVPRNSLMGLR